MGLWCDCDGSDGHVQGILGASCQVCHQVFAIRESGPTVIYTVHARIQGSETV
jgi:hypothetical protein